MKLQRHPANPILVPDPLSHWERYNVFNASVIYHNGLFHMHYRAQGTDWISRIGYAVSVDGIRWNRLREPVLAPDGSPRERRGVEDPRVTLLDGVFYMCYTAYGFTTPEQGLTQFNGATITPMIARSTNLITWERLGPLVVGEDNKDHVLFPRKIRGRYAILHRRRPHIWIAYSDDLVHWDEADMAPIFGPRPDNPWDNTAVGANGVPIETEHGWLFFYHGYNEHHVYNLGVCLLDLDDPTRVIHRPTASLLAPEEMWEVRGDVANVVFSCANLRVGDQVYVYYGGADHVIALAIAPFDELLDFARSG